MTRLETISRADEAAKWNTSDPILIIDDDVDWVIECGFMLESFGYTSISATTQAQALQQIESHSVSTVIIDYNMPDGDGLTLIHELSARAAADGRQLSFIMATGHATLDIAVGAMRASAVDFLQKPVSRADLQKALLRMTGVQSEAPARSALIDRLAGLSSEMQHLAELMGNPTAVSAQRSIPTDSVPARHNQVTADFIRSLLRSEAKRKKLGNGELFGDPAWDMLLDLLVAKLENRSVSVSSACIASGAPTTTALRLVNRLVNDNILCRVPDERDGRRDFLMIHPQIEEPLLNHLADLNRAA